MEDDVNLLAFTPLYYGERLRIVNPRGDIGIVTLWSPTSTAERLLGRISPNLLDPEQSRIAVISNLYGDGLHQMLCNLLYNPQIHHIVAVGESLGLPTASEIEALLERGVEETSILGSRVHRIQGTDRVFPITPNFDLEILRRRINFKYLGRFSDNGFGDAFIEHLRNLPKRPVSRASLRIRVEIPPALPGDYTYRPSDLMSHQVARASPLDCWEELVTRAVRFGRPVELRSGPRLELLNTRVVITNPTDDPEAALAEYGFSLKQFREYQRTMLDSTKPPDIDYTYGNRLAGYFSSGGTVTDSMKLAASQLIADPESRKAFISLWDTSRDLVPGTASTPCLVTIFLRRSGERLTLTATYRAHNLLTAWLQNAYGLMAIQKEVCRRTGMMAGKITVISHSLGIDPRSPRYGIAKAIAGKWTRDEDLDRDTGRHSLREDPNGYFMVTIDAAAGEIVAEHRFEGLLVKQYRGDKAVKIEREVIGDMAVSLVSHALWLGRELKTKEDLLSSKRRPGDDA
ncbi:Thymidylat_synt domain-containing protein [Frankia sp. Hr75.2]|nr:Thymidylat_synt domain-containing protein [Frankia sp. Hr75.2]